MNAVSAQTSSRKRWINNDPDFLLGLAAHITSDETIECITSVDRSILCSSARDKSSWNRLASQTTSSQQRRTPQGQYVDRHPDALTSLFRARCLIFENSISELFPSPDEGGSLLDSYEIRRQAAELGRKEESSMRQGQHRALSEDDEYDENEECGDILVDDLQRRSNAYKDGDAQEHQDAKLSFPSLSLTKPAQAHGNSEHDESIFDTVADRENEDAILSFEIDTTYHTLEFDRHALLEQNTLEASDRRVEEETEPAEKEKFSAVNFGAANLSLKHLISKIDESREKLLMSDNELRSLLSDVRKNRSKWASEDKVGQEELYEAAEKVVLELRGYTEHSTAFLNKVTKRDVPDYYNIIKVPMDLGTLMKNLKNLQYKSKAEFEHDLMLIWNNCLTYNADAAHVLRKHAYAMRRKSEQLLAMVPNVIVRNRADLDAEELELGDPDIDEEDDDDDRPLAGKSTRGTFGSKSAKAKKSKATTQSKIVSADGRDGAVAGTDSREVETETLLLPQRLDQVQKSVKLEMDESSNVFDRVEDHGGSDDDDIAEVDIALQIWRTRTKKTRARYASSRHRRLRLDTIRPDDPALVIMPGSLARIPQNSAVVVRSISAGGAELAHESTLLGNSDDLTLREYELCCAPELGQANEEGLLVGSASRIHDTTRYEPLGGLWDKMRSTTLEMKNIRRLCTKLSTLKLMQDPTMSAFPASYFRQLMEADTPLQFRELELDQLAHGSDDCGEDLARALMRRSSSYILYQAGFEDFQSQALECFAEIAGEFLQTVGKVMKEYNESHQLLTEEEKLRHTLFEVGIPSLNDLEDYVVEEIDTKSEKIVALHDRLRKFLNDFIQGTVEGDGTDQDLFDENNRDAFVAGNFGDETGEDFFGFKELGLDKEFGMSSLSVPLRLLQGRLRPNSGVNAVNNAEGISGLRFDRKFHHITREHANKQIGLFKIFLETKFDLLDPEEENQYLMEDEDLPMRQRKPKPRLGPSGKIGKHKHLSCTCLQANRISFSECYEASLERSTSLTQKEEENR